MHHKGSKLWEPQYKMVMPDLSVFEYRSNLRLLRTIIGRYYRESDQEGGVVNLCVQLRRGWCILGHGWTMPYLRTLWFRMRLDVLHSLHSHWMGFRITSFFWRRISAQPKKCPVWWGQIFLFLWIRHILHRFLTSGASGDIKSSRSDPEFHELSA